MTDYKDTHRKLGTELTERITAYRAQKGDPPTGDFEALKQWLVDYPYAKQERLQNPTDPAYLLAVSGNEDGTFDEVERCYAYGLLTKDEFYAVNRAIWEKYAPDRMPELAAQEAARRDRQKTRG